MPQHETDRLELGERVALTAPVHQSKHYVTTHLLPKASKR